MATRAPLRPRCTLRPLPPRARGPRRTFLSGLLQPDNKPLTINATRTLPYARAQLYDLIVDVDAYARFLPYCRRSRVTAWSAPDAGGPRRWPVEGELTVGLGPVAQSYTSRIVCVPGRSVEALSGNQEAVAGKDAGGNNPFKRLVTKWTVEDAPAPRTRDGGAAEWTRVDLDLSMSLEDPLIQAMMSKVADDAATKMIEAFEQRAKELFGSPR